MLEDAEQNGGESVHDASGLVPVEPTASERPESATATTSERAEVPDPELKAQIIALCKESDIKKRAVVLRQNDADEIIGVVLPVPTDREEDDKYVLLLDDGRIVSLTTLGNDGYSETFRVNLSNGRPWIIEGDSGEPKTRQELIDKISRPNVGFRGALATHVGQFEEDTSPLRQDLLAGLGEVQKVVGPRNEARREATRQNNIKFAKEEIGKALA